MNLINIFKGLLFDKGGKILAGAGLAVFLFDIIQKYLDSGESVKICLELGQGGGLLFLAGLAIFIAFKSDPHKNDAV